MHIYLEVNNINLTICIFKIIINYYCVENLGNICTKLNKIIYYNYIKYYFECV